MLLLCALAQALSGPHLATDGERVLSVWNGGIGSLGPIDVRLVGPDGSVSNPRHLPAEGLCGVAWTGQDYALGTVVDHEIHLRRITRDGQIGAPRTVGRSNDRDLDVAGWQCAVAASDGHIWMAWRTCPTLLRDGCPPYDPGLTLTLVEIGEAVTPVPIPGPVDRISLGALDASPAGPVLYWERRPDPNPGTCRIGTLASGAAAPAEIPCDNVEFGGGALLLRRGSHHADLWHAGTLRPAFDAPELGLMETVTAAGPAGPVAFVHGGDRRVRFWDGHTLLPGPDGFPPRYAVRLGASWLLESWDGELLWLGEDGRPRPLGLQPLGPTASLVGVVDLGDTAAAVRSDAAGGLRLFTGNGRGPPEERLLAADGRAATVDPVARTVSWRDPDGAWLLSLERPENRPRRVDPVPVPVTPLRDLPRCVDAGHWQACLEGEGVRLVDRAHQTVDGRPLADLRAQMAAQSVARVRLQGGRLTVEHTLSGPILDGLVFAGGPADGTWLAGFDDLTARWFAPAEEEAFVAPWVVDVPRRPRLVALFRQTDHGVTRSLEVYADGRLVHERRQHDCWGPQDPSLPICDPAPDQVDRREHTLGPAEQARWITRVAERDPALAAELRAVWSGGPPPRITLPEWAAALEE